jgi:hypothetical protein
VLDLDRMPDPDGRYRVNQFYCRGDSWQMTVRQLVRETSAVLMDLRGFSTRNQGCVYELGQILNSSDLRQALFVVDSTTNREFLGEVLRQLWAALSHDSPNYSSIEPSVRLFFIRTQNGGELRSLLRALWAACLAPRASYGC